MHPGQVAFKQGVGRLSRGMRHQLNLFTPVAQARQALEQQGQHLANSYCHARGRAVSGRHAGAGQHRARRLQQHAMGKGAANVDPDAQARHAGIIGRSPGLPR